MGNHRSTRWRGYTKKMTVESCRRLSPREAPHAGIATLTAPMPRGGGLRRWCLCPRCNRRKGDLFQPPGLDSWACRSCLDLTYTAQQRRRKPAAKPLPETWAEFVAIHPLWKSYQQWKVLGAALPTKQTLADFEKALTSVMFEEYCQLLQRERAKTRG
jgi:hypothetical protein